MAMNRRRVEFGFLNIGHFFDHFLILIFATVAVALATDRQVEIAGALPAWRLSYAELIPFSAAGFAAFGAFSIPAGWLADRWSRPAMMAIFFFGLGLATVGAGLARAPWHLGVAIFFIGMAGAIYHPVGMAMVVAGRAQTGMALALNGVFGNLGVAAAPAVTLLVVINYGWQWAFVGPGIACLGMGFCYLAFLASGRSSRPDEQPISEPASGRASPKTDRRLLLRVFAVVFVTAAIGGFVFQSTTFALPKIFDERLAGLADTGARLGMISFAVLAAASLAQLVVGFLVDRVSIRLVFAVITAMQAVLFTFMIKLSGGMALVVAVGFMLAVFGQIPINDVLISRMVRSHWHARAYALRYVLSFTVMASTVPVLAWLHGAYGFAGLFVVMATGGAVMFAAVLFLPARAGHRHAGLDAVKTETGR
jgi:MFS family permease